MSPTGRIPTSFIETVLARTDIVSLIQESVPLKRTGANYSACCPFHQEKTPSFSVNAQKQFFHCFGCGKHGDSIGFVMDQQALSFVDAITLLAGRLGLPMPLQTVEEKDEEKQTHKSTLLACLKQASDYYQQQLKSQPNAINYLKERGLTGTVAKFFTIGFANERWQNLIEHFNADEQKLVLLEEGGLIIKHPKGRYYDRFRNRIMFPIRDKKGQVIGFGGRVMDQSQPKYLNSPETILFQKGSCWYGVYEAFQLNKRLDRIIVVEGYLDVIALVQFKIAGVLATLGTAITTAHLLQGFQWVNEIIFCFDGDKAGRAAAWKALQLTLPVLTSGRQAKFVFLPPGSDPDSYIRANGLAAFEDLVQNSMPLSEYLLAILAQQVPPTSMDNKAQLVDIARPLIEQIPAQTLREMLFEQLAQLTASSNYVVRGKRFKKSFNSSIKKTAFIPPPSPIHPTFFASTILYNHPHLYSGIELPTQWPQSLQIPGLSLLKTILELIHLNPQTTKVLLHEALIAKGFNLELLKECEKQLSLLPNSALLEELKGAFERLEKVFQNIVLEKLLLKAKTGELSDIDKQNLTKILTFRESID